MSTRDVKFCSICLQRLIYNITACVKIVCPREYDGGAEFTGQENDGQRNFRGWKLQDWKMTDKSAGLGWKMQDWNMTDKVAGVENAGLENDGQHNRG